MNTQFIDATLDVAQFYTSYHIDYYVRAVVVGFFSLFLVRVGNSRLFSQLAAYDLLIFVILGALLGTAIINKDLFFSSLICCLIITYLHRFFGYLASHHLMSHFLKDKRFMLYENNKWQNRNLEECSLNKADIYQELRNTLGINNLNSINKIIMEGNGKISFLKKEKS